MIKRIVAVAAFISLSGMIGLTRSLWNDRNVYSTIDQLNVNDIVIVNVEDISNMQFNLSMDSRNNFSISSNPDKAITGFLPKIASDRQIKSDDRSNFASKGKMRFSIAARVENKAAANSYKISGSKILSVNGNTSIVTVNGFVDPAMVKGRTVDSGSVADFTIDIRGVKVGIALERGKVKEGETANATLSEDEKQKIIVDYLQKMISELTR